MAVIASNACPRRSKTITGWSQGLSRPEGRSAYTLSFTLPLMLPRSTRFLQVEISLHCASVNVFMSCSDHVQEFPKQVWPVRLNELTGPFKIRTKIAGKKSLSRKPICTADLDVSSAAIKTEGKCCQKQNSQQRIPTGHLQHEEVLEILPWNHLAFKRETLWFFVSLLKGRQLF